MYITEFFDPYSTKHLVAYQYLEKHGTFPKEFLPKNVIYERGWKLKIITTLANIYAKFGVEGKIIDMPVITP